MNRKGFTLVELLAVLVLLSVIVLVAFPSILNTIKKTDETLDSATEALLIANAKSYANDLTSTTATCVNISTLVEEGYTESPIANTDSEKSETIETSWSVTFRFDSSTWKYTDFKVKETGC